jgi:hypothetical protein
MADKVTRTFRFDSDLIKKAEVLAKMDRRSLNNWLEVLIDKEICAEIKNKDNTSISK